MQARKETIFCLVHQKVFDPQSSISFFKLLTDIINSEHWGIAERGPHLLRHVFPELAWAPEIADAICRDVFSVTFYNSIVVVTKADPAAGRVSGIGTRFIAGSETKVTKPAEHGSKLPLDESSNPFAQFSKSGEGPDTDCPGE